MIDSRHHDPGLLFRARLYQCTVTRARRISINSSTLSFYVSFNSVESACKSRQSITLCSQRRHTLVLFLRYKSLFSVFVPYDFLNFLLNGPFTYCSRMLYPFGPLIAGQLSAVRTSLARPHVVATICPRAYAGLELVP